MLKKKRIYVTGLLCMSLMGNTIEAKNVSNEEFKEEITLQEESEDPSENLGEQIQEEIISEQIEEMIQQELGIEKFRLDTFIKQDGLMTQRDFARILCYALRLSPIYTQVPNEDPYIASLKQAGIWNDAIPEQITELDKEIINQCIQIAKIYKGASLSTPFFKPVPMGFIQKSTMKVKVNEEIYPMYYLNNVNYVRLSDLKQIGFEKVYYNGYMRLILKEEGGAVLKIPETETLTNKVATLHIEKIYIGNVLSYVLKCGEDLLIPLRGLSEYYDLNIEGQLCTLKEKYNMATHYIELAPGIVHNISDEVIQAQIVSVFWNGEEIIEEQVTIENLMPDEYYPINEGLYALDTKVTHVSTMVAGIQTDTMMMQVPYKSYGQHTESILKNYTLHQNDTLDTYMSKLFPESKVIGTMKYGIKGFQKGEKVDVWAAEDGYSYYLLKDGKKIEVPWNSVSIPPNPAVCKEQVPVEIIEGYINSKQVKSKTPYFIWTDLYRQRTYVFKNKDGRWHLIRDMLTSTGRNKTPTPTGEFEVQAYVPAFGMNKGYRCKNALHLFGDYLYHSVMFDVKGRYVLGGQGQLGERASHGCLRLSPENSEWLYNTISLGTKVWIR